MHGSVSLPTRTSYRVRILLCLADDVPRVDDARYPTQNAQSDVDPQIRRATSFQGYGNEGNPNRQEVEEDGALGVG
jgi:hypothetical protein